MSFDGARAWIRRHPVRLAVYLLLATAACVGLLVVRGVMAGEQDVLLTRLAGWPALRNWVERQGIARYSLDSVRVAPGGAGCGTQISITGATFSLLAPGAARVHSDHAQLCSSLRAMVDGFQVGTERQPDMLAGARASASLTGARAEGLRWTHPAGSSLLTATDLTSTLQPLAARIANLRLLPAADSTLAEIAQTSAGPVNLSGKSVTIGKVQAEGVQALLRQEADGRWNAAEAAPRFQAAAASLMAMADASLGELGRVLGRVRGLFLWAAILACLLIFGGKLLLVRVPPGMLWRIAVAAFPVLLSLLLYAVLFGSAPVRTFILCSLVATAALAAALEIAFYRRGAEWHERVEPLLLDLLAPFLILPPLAGYGYPVVLPAGIPRPAALSVAESEVRDTVARAQLALCGNPVAGQARLSLATARNLQVGIDPASFAIRTVVVDRLQALGQADRAAIAPLDRLLYLPAAWKQTPSVAFCANVTVGSGVVPAECDAAGASDGTSVNAAAAVDFDHPAAQIAATLHSPAIALHLTARADLEGAEIQEVRTLAGSPVKVGDAGGHVSWTRDLQSRFHLARVEAQAASSRLAAGVLELNGTFPLSCSAGRSNLQARVGGAEVTAGDGYDFRVEDTRFSMLLSRRRELSSKTELRGVRLLGKRFAEPAPWLTGDIPSVQLGLRGRLSAGSLPRRFAGEATMAVARASGESAVGLSAPLHFTADLWRGELDLPAQSFTLHQSVVSRLPTIPMRMSLTARLESLAGPLRAQAGAQVEIPRLLVAEPPLGAELNQITVRAALRSPGPSMRLSYASGWNRVTLPKLPGSFDLNEIPRFEAATEGSARGLPSWDALSSDLGLLGQWARRNVPAIPTELSFRFAGDWPAEPGVPVLTAETRSGLSVRVDAFAGNASLVTLPDARLAKATLDTRATGIHTGKGAGDLTFAARSDLAGDAIDLAIAEPLSASLHSRAGQVQFALNGELAIGPLMSRLDPFLAQAGIRLDGVTLPGRVTALRSTLNFAQSELKGFDFQAALGAGTLASLDFGRILHPESPRFLQTLAVTQTAPLELRATAPPASFPRVNLSLRSPAMAVDLNRGAQQATFSADTSALLTLVDRGKSRSLPVLDRLADAAGGLRRHMNHALDIFSGDLPPVESVRWKADFGGHGKPVLSLEADGLELALRSRVDHFSWLSAGHESSAGATADLAARLGLHEGHLILDADTPVKASLALHGRPPSTWDFRLPLLLALDEHLQPAGPSSADLWDASYYESLWHGYRPRYATSAEAWINRSEFVLSGLSFQEVIFPSEPFRLAVGYGEPLELHAPAAARLLFGRSDGIFQARLNWLPKAVSVDSRTRVTFKDLQAAGIGLAHAPGRVAFLEDTLEGGLQASTDALLVDSRFVPRLLADASTVTELDKLGINLNVHTVRGSLPGMLQASTGLNVDLYAALLNSLAQQLGLQAPPRAVRYRHMGLDLQVTRGEVATRPLLLNLQGVEIPGLESLTSADVRVHWGKERGGFAGAPLRFRNLLGFLQRSLGPLPVN